MKFQFNTADYSENIAIRLQNQFKFQNYTIISIMCFFKKIIIAAVIPQMHPFSPFFVYSSNIPKSIRMFKISIGLMYEYFKNAAITGFVHYIL